MPVIKEPSTINELEAAVQAGLESLRSIPFDETIRVALKTLTPEGYRPIVQLEEDGRKKRSNAAASNWNPDLGEVVIYFEKITPNAVPLNTAAPLPKFAPAPMEATATPPLKTEPSQPQTAADAATEIRECCEALSAAEAAGKPFVAFKWFRDNALARLPHPWCKTAEQRQRVLSLALESQAIVTQRIPNPNLPLHPTTTVALNRASAAMPLESRFSPITMKGEPLSTTIDRDRGEDRL